MFAIIENVHDSRDRSILEFEDLIKVTRKFCHIPEDRARFKDGSNRRLFSLTPIFELREEAEEYLRLLKERNALQDNDKIATLNKSMSLLVATRTYAGSFRSNAPVSRKTAHYFAWQESGAVEILTEEKA